MRARLLCLFLFLAVPLAQAEEQLRATQEELRRRNVFFGDIDGRQTSELGEALKRYQRRKGFVATGRPDSATLRSLGLLPRDPREPAPKELPLPEEPVLKSDVKIDPAKEARKVSQETGLALASLGPVAEKDLRASRHRRNASPSAAPAPSGRERFTPAPDTGGTRLRPSAGGQAVQAADLAPLVRGYLKAASGSDLQAELRFLADKVDYLGHGVMDRRVIERTLRAYYHRWPKHSYHLHGPVQYRKETFHGRVIVTCVVDFQLKRGSTKASGRINQRIVFDAATSDPRIVSIQEQRVR